jgi:fatty acid desaturase
MEPAAIDWYRVPVDREALRRFTRKSDRKGWLQSGSFLLIFAGTTAAAYYFFSVRLWIPMVLVCYVHAVFHQMVGMSAAVHELSHGTVFKSKAPNEFFYYLFCFLTWNNPVHFRASHTNHHLLTLYRGRDKEVIQRPVKDTINWVNYVSWATFDFAWFWLLVKTNVLHALGNGDADFFSWDPLLAPDDPRRKAMIGWARFAVISYIVLIVVFAVLHLWVLIYLIVFGSFFASILGRLCGAVQHYGLSESVPDWRLVTHTFMTNPVVGYLYWYMNYHAEHHMYAAVPCFNLGRFHKAIEKDMQVPLKSLPAGLRLLHRIKRRQRENPGYQHVPEFPPGAAAPKWS